MTVLMPLGEAVIDALVTKLETGLPAAITQINDADTKGIVLPDVALVLPYVPAPASNNRFPLVAVSQGPLRFADDTGYGATGHHLLNLLTFVQDADQERLGVALQRYTQAVISVACEGRTVGDAWGMKVLEVRPGPTLGREEGPREWLSWMAVVIELMTEQDQIG